MASGTERPQLTAETKVALLLDVSQRTRGTLDLDELLERLLTTLASLVDFDAGVVFVTAFLAVLDPADGALAYANCGHDPPFAS